MCVHHTICDSIPFSLNIQSLSVISFRKILCQSYARLSMECCQRMHFARRDWGSWDCMQETSTSLWTLISFQSRCHCCGRRENEEGEVKTNQRAPMPHSYVTSCWKRNMAFLSLMQRLHLHLHSTLYLFIYHIHIAVKFSVFTDEFVVIVHK